MTATRAFQVIPSIDLRGGRVVRLFQGDYARETDYALDAVTVAKRWQAEGGTLIHVVDLDGAKDGRPVNGALIEAICAAVSVPVEVSGGMRSMDLIRVAFAAGASRVQIGSAAVRDPDLVRDACAAFPGQIVVSIDSLDGIVMTDGWTKEGDVAAVELAQKMVALGVPRIMYTDIARDGMLQGPNVRALQRLVQSVGIPVIASGGISTIDQLRAVAATGCEGAIIGKALYEGAINLAEAIQAVQKSGEPTSSLITHHSSLC